MHAWVKTVSFAIYGFSLCALFAMSALHHGLNGSDTVNRVFRTLDYSAVYALIFGTITPVCLVLFPGVLGYSTLITAALVIGFGITMRSVFHTLPSYISLTLYLCLGWLPVIMILLSPNTLSPRATVWLLVGGISYTLGSVVFGRQKPNPIPGKLGFHELWHIFVLFGALAHYIFIYQFVLHY